MLWPDAFIAVSLVSVISFAGILTLSVSIPRLRRLLFALISFAIGALLGDVFLHILPQMALGGTVDAEGAALLFAGFLTFFILEKFLRWHHGHEGEVHHPDVELDRGHELRHVGYLNLISDGLHNFIDGLVIGGSYLVSRELGIATTVAVVLHEIPQEIGDFGLLLHVGFSRAQALLANFVSALAAFGGLLVLVIFREQSNSLAAVILPITAGGFLYIAGSDLVPELHKTTDLRKSLIQLAAIVMGFAVMALLLALE